MDAYERLSLPDESGARQHCWINHSFPTVTRVHRGHGDRELEYWLPHHVLCVLPSGAGGKIPYQRLFQWVARHRPRCALRIRSPKAALYVEPMGTDRSRFICGRIVIHTSNFTLDPSDQLRWSLNHFAGFDEAAEFFLGGELVLALLCGGRSHFLIRDRQSLQLDDTQIQRLAVVAVHSRGCLPDLALLKSHARTEAGMLGRGNVSLWSLLSLTSWFIIMLYS